MSKNLIWFRNDLRIHDNTALHEACKFHEDKVLALFISTPKQWSDHFISKKKISFIYHHVISLKEELLKLNIILNCYESTDFINLVEYLVFFCLKNKINKLFYNYQYELNESNRDYLVTKKLSEKGIYVKGFHDNLLVSSDKVKNLKNETYKVFSFFKKKVVENLYNNIPICLPIPIKRKSHRDIFLEPIYFKKVKVHFDPKLFPIGEKHAINRLKNFCSYKMQDYSLKRNFPFLDGTSMLSPYLSLGILSPRYCLRICLELIKDTPEKFFLTSPWFNQILWREFYYHLLIGFPKISQHQSLSNWEKNIAWSEDIKKFKAWKDGNTGFPIIDAGMRQLNKLGWMHNRLRMITSSFLTKNLLINWRKGEKYFINNLIDGDLALNNGGWQWSASVGTDTVPYIRLFNPFQQSKNFDASGAFIRKFLPELKSVPNYYIHQPLKWSKKENFKLDYPKPIINYDDSRRKSLLIFQQAKLNFKK